MTGIYPVFEAEFFWMPTFVNMLGTVGNVFLTNNNFLKTLLKVIYFHSDFCSIVCLFLLIIPIWDELQLTTCCVQVSNQLKYYKGKVKLNRTWLIESIWNHVKIISRVSGVCKHILFYIIISGQSTISLCLFGCTLQCSMVDV